VHHAGGEPRDFAMFSGGEAFRIAFAVRLAMSKLLVRRAGARLETLVIDEGFGTQDPEGRERLIAAIQLAQREFRKILVITHLDDLKDAFATQIRVTKDERRGSVLSIESA
jgi:exonuclease SbcC